MNSSSSRAGALEFLLQVCPIGLCTIKALVGGDRLKKSSWGGQWATLLLSGNAGCGATQRPIDDT